MARHSSSRTCLAVLIGVMVIEAFRFTLSAILRMGPVWDKQDRLLQFYAGV